MSEPVRPPLLEPGLPGGRPAAQSAGPAGAMVRLDARVVAMAGPDPLIETAHGRAVLQGGPPLRPGTPLILELARAPDAAAREGSLVSVDRQRLEPPAPIRLRPVPPVLRDAAAPATTGLEVKLRPIGPDRRPLLPGLAARLVPVPEPPLLSTGSAPLAPALTGRAPGLNNTTSGASTLTEAASPTEHIPRPLPAPREASPAASPAAPRGATTAGEPPARSGQVATTEQALALGGRGQPIEVTVLSRDARGRVVLGSIGIAFEVETPLDLPVGARLQLTLSAGRVRPDPGRTEAGPLEAVRELATALKEAEAQPNDATPRLPQPAATLAARLLRLIQLITQRSGEASGRATTAAGGTARITAPPAAALAEIGRLAGEPQPGGWRAFLLPLAFEGAPLLRLYVREEQHQDAGGNDRRHARSFASRRAVFDLEFGELGRCQIDVLCRAQRFDLVVRTARPLEPQLRSDIRELHTAALDAAGLSGSLGFRVVAWVPLPEPVGSGGRAGVTV